MVDCWDGQSDHDTRTLQALAIQTKAACWWRLIFLIFIVEALAFFQSPALHPARKTVQYRTFAVASSPATGPRPALDPGPRIPKQDLAHFACKVFQPLQSRFGKVFSHNIALLRFSARSSRPAAPSPGHGPFVYKSELSLACARKFGACTQPIRSAKDRARILRKERVACHSPQRVVKTVAGTRTPIVNSKCAHQQLLKGRR